MGSAEHDLMNFHKTGHTCEASISSKTQHSEPRPPTPAQLGSLLWKTLESGF